MPRVIAVFVAALSLLPLESAAQQNSFRPLHLRDMVKAVGTNTDGMPADELPKRITTYALHIGDKEGVGVSAGFADDPDGAIIVSWRSNGELWRYAWLEEPELGRLEAFKPVEGGFALETTHADGRMVSAILRADLTVVGLVNGGVRSVVHDAAADVMTITTRSASAASVTCREVKTRTGGYCR